MRSNHVTLERIVKKDIPEMTIHSDTTKNTFLFGF